MSEKEAAEIVVELEARHRDVIDPVIARINETYANHDGDSIFYLYQALVTMSQTINNMLRSGHVIPSGSGPNRPGMNA
ncbi:MAG: hypothetical protein NTW71_12990 [Deltaproteobacteria bacterium]|nr:hypothetical protein [Deltaproteobacteria bacterium]